MRFAADPFVARARLSAIIFFMLLTGCDRKTGIVPLQQAVTQSIQIGSVAQLQLRRPTHLTCDALGNLFWTQESDGGGDALFAAGASNLPQTTTLTSASILNAMRSAGPHAGGTPPPPKSTGNIQSIVAGADGTIYFYFSGGDARSGAEALGQFDPRSSAIRILASTDALAAASRLGRTLDLARGTLLSLGNGQTIRLFLRHTDGWVLLDFDPRRLPPAGNVSLLRTISNVQRGDTKLDLSDEQLNLFAAPVLPGSDSQNATSPMLLIDHRRGEIDQIDDVGAATFAGSLVLLPDALSDPAIEQSTPQPSAQVNAAGPAAREIVFFVADAPPLDPRNSNRPDPANVQADYPALLRLNLSTRAFDALSRDTMHAPGEFAVHSLRLSTLIPTAPNQYAAFDETSGQLLRLRVTTK